VQSGDGVRVATSRNHESCSGGAMGWLFAVLRLFLYVTGGKSDKPSTEVSP